MRYIDADKLVESLRADYDREGEKADTYALNGDDDLAVKYSHGQFCYLNAMERVKDAPTADVAPKFEIERGDNGIDYCPLCGSYSITAEGMDRLRMAHKEPGQHGDPVGEPGDSAIDVAKLEVAREIFEETMRAMESGIAEADKAVINNISVGDFCESLCRAGEMYAGYIGMAICKVFQKYAEGGYCPCALFKTVDTKCMCKDFREQIAKGIPGKCHCGLYEGVLEE